ncbi:hypothetical protein BSU04_28170 [Caballeronia sordidicola]|jgi:hypothetical protein|uniref:Uncharacterized protein n=1 Tax=Caballeronia sordidicola TaxID=196367 RepID=A0A226WX93_CABSO|nr:hypothetical protein BSU04_28170 [Caballeronia sordidicola]
MDSGFSRSGQSELERTVGPEVVERVYLAIDDLLTGLE